MRPCTGEVMGVAHLGPQMDGLNHSTASDMLGFKTTLAYTRIA